MGEKSNVQVMMNKDLLRIVIIGPESTGKSTLCRELAKHYKTSWCPEFARQYLLKHGKEYTFEDLLTIAKGQIVMEDEYAEKSKRKWEEQTHPETQQPLLFVDTDMYVMKVWSEFVFGKCHQWIIDKIVERPYDLYLLCHTDLPWEQDELREYPDLATREKLFHMYRDILVNQSVPWANIYGNDQGRFERSVNAVDALLKKQ